VTCDHFLDRLYDDDVRAARRGHGAVPPDLAEHIRDCPDCRLAYDAAGADERLLTPALRGSPSPAWRAEVLRQMAPPRSAWTLHIAAVNEAITWGILAVAASHVLLGGNVGLTHVAAFWTGGAAALFRTRLGRPLTLVFPFLRA
jgi:hypothetical protein